jgi:hypothetical protein
LPLGNYSWYVAGYEVDGLTSISDFDISKLTFLNGSQDTIGGSFIVP